MDISYRAKTDNRCKLLGLEGPPGWADCPRSMDNHREARRSFNWKKLRAILLGLWAFRDQVIGHYVQVLSDNDTAVAYITRQGGARSRVLLSSALQIMSWAESNLASLTAVHLKGELNKIADFISRERVLESEWSLNPHIFQRITGRWETPQIDLFASHANTKVEMYFSLDR